MTIPELNKRLEGVKKDFQKNLGNTMIQIGNDALEALKLRIQKTGIDANGQKYRPYSTESMLVGKKGFKNQSHASKIFGKQKNRELKWVTLDKLNSSGKKIRLAVLEGGYKKFRDLNNLQSGFVDFTFTTNMWSNIGIVSSRSEADKGTVKIAAKSEKEKKKLEGNTARRGDILALSNKEIDELVKRFGMNIQQIIIKEGLG